MTSGAETRDSNDQIAWLVIAAMVSGIGVAELRSPLAIVPRSLMGLAIACAALSASASFYRRVRPREPLAVSCAALVQALLFSAAGSILSYLLARRGGMLWDSTLYSWDRALGFDWLACVRLVDAHPSVALVLGLGYVSLIPQTIVVIIALGFSGRFAPLRIVILAAMLSGLAAILISPLMPALGNFAYLGLQSDALVHVHPSTGYVADLNAVRSGRMAALDLAQMQGIITFPSYHAALATVTLWGFWSNRMAWLRWAGAAVAIITVAATPVIGTHYLVDVVAGIAVGAASIWGAGRLVYVRVPFAAVTAWPFRRSRAAFAR